MIMIEMELIVKLLDVMYVYVCVCVCVCVCERDLFAHYLQVKFRNSMHDTYVAISYLNRQLSVRSHDSHVIS